MSNESNVSELYALKKWLHDKPNTSSNNTSCAINVLIKKLDKRDVQTVTDFCLNTERASK